ncbi:MAG: hypothetical protein AAF799_46495 [Myxococcota bacterium]
MKSRGCRTRMMGVHASWAGALALVLLGGCDQQLDRDALGLEDIRDDGCDITPPPPPPPPTGGCGGTASTCHSSMAPSRDALHEYEAMGFSSGEAAMAVVDDLHPDMGLVSSYDEDDANGLYAMMELMWADQYAPAE